MVYQTISFEAKKCLTPLFSFSFMKFFYKYKTKFKFELFYAPHLEKIIKNMMDKTPTQIYSHKIPLNSLRSIHI